MNPEQILISVIVPIYKVEEYLPQCIESLLNQKYDNLEILLIDDGSPDRCGEICDVYAKKDSRIQVYHKRNGGIGDALNYGINRAKGKYISFVDGDDYIVNQDAFRLLIREAMQSDADIILGNYVKDIDGRMLLTKDHGFYKGISANNSNFRLTGFFINGHLAYYWGKLYKRIFLLQHNLLLKHYIYASDKLFNMECYLHLPKYSYISEVVYVYRVNPASISHKYKEEYSQLWLDISEEIYADLMKLNVANDYMDLVAFNLLFAVFFSCKQEQQVHTHKLSAVIKELKKFREHPLMQMVIKDILRGKYLEFHGLLFWKLMLWSVSFCLQFILFGLISFAIKILVFFEVDERLSSTGKVG
ncbi:MAG: epsJ [Herbinix sp.]|jgi:glycosyltransferase involved in cell wall biosynthesis|nr:epsJ [Herbinix sp.]